MDLARYIPAGGILVEYGHKEALPRIPGHGVEGHPPDESLRWDETPLAAVWLARLQLPNSLLYYSGELSFSIHSFQSVWLY